MSTKKDAEKHLNQRLDAERDWINKGRNSKYRNATTNADTVGLALSGGGVRSASFNLGVLQALAKNKRFDQIDYLSTVSGGGYIGTSLTWLLRHFRGTNVFPFGTTRDDNDKLSGKIVSWLRLHGSYWTHGAGLSMMTLISVVLRGLLINLAFLLSLIFLACLWLAWSEANSEMWTFGDALIVYGSVLFAFWGIAAFAVFVFSSLGIGKTRTNGELWTTLMERKLADRLLGLALSIGIAMVVLGSVPMFANFFLGFDGWGKVYGAIPGIVGVITTVVGWRSKGSKETGSTVVKVATTIGILLLVYTTFVVTYVATSQIENLSDRLLFLHVIVSLVCVVIWWRINPNVVSLHHFYRDRLLEAYMPDPIALGCLEEDEVFDTRAIVNEAETKGALHDVAAGQRPYHLINATHYDPDSKDLKARYRGGENFVMSPLTCGSDSTDFKCAHCWDTSFSLATAMAISGAAINPNWGATRIRLLGFLMAMLNVRMGYWAKSPAAASHAKPRISLLFREGGIPIRIPGLPNSYDSLIHLTDGGHFENMGLYELVRRRCKMIIVCDAEADPDIQFSGLGKVIELVRVDFGAAIKINTKPLQPPKDDPRKIVDTPFVVGNIRYEDGSMGKLFYVKTSMIPDLPEDIYAYQRFNRSFPDQTTSDQFFDERQFEAYRELGFQTGHRLANDNTFQSNMDLIVN